MDQVHVVRHKVLVEGRTQRSVARELGIARRTVQKYVAQAAPSRVEAAPRRRPIWEVVGPRIETLLTESVQWTGGKQRLTATRLHQLIRAEGHAVGVTVVKAAVAEWKRQRREVMIPPDVPRRRSGGGRLLRGARRSGRQAPKGVALRVALDVLRPRLRLDLRAARSSQFSRRSRPRLRASGRRAGRIAYDNLRPAVTRILVGGERALTARFAALASHYLVEPCFCRPGVGHDKGGVEARGKAIRTQALVPIPSGLTLATINDALLAQLDARAETRRAGTDETIGARFVEEQQRLRLVEIDFVADAATIATITPRALARVEGAFYSVPCRWAGLDLVAWIGATTITIVGADGRRILHPRLRFGQRSIDYRHYLPMLAQKPQAVRQVLPDLLRDLGAPFPTVWDHFERLHGPRDAARLFAKILGQLETRGAAEIVPALETALVTGTPLLLALAPTTRSPDLPRDAIPVGLRDVEVGGGCAADYDVWLGGAA